MTLVDEIRAFNLFYTHEMGLLDRHLPASDLSLPEARVLYELATAGHEGGTAADIGRALCMDKAHLSRIVARLRGRGLVRGRISPRHGRHVHPVAVGSRPADIFRPRGWDAGADGRAAVASGSGSPPTPRHRVARRSIVADAQSGRRRRCSPEGRCTGGPRLDHPPPGPPLSPRIWLRSGHTRDWSPRSSASSSPSTIPSGKAPRSPNFEAGSSVRCFSCAETISAVAKLWVLYVEPAVSSRGIGRLLVDACIGRARSVGYRQLTLWTNDVLTSARRIYEASGFRLASEAPHHSFGCDLVGQTWTLDLD